MLREVEDEIVTGLREAGVTFGAYVPDSWMAPLIERLSLDPDVSLMPVTNEGEGVAMCAGAWLGGRVSVMVMENSGLRMACEELARLGLGQGIPVFLLMPYRGDFGDSPSWAQPHAWTMEPILRALRVTYRVVRRVDEVRSAVAGVPATMRASKNHVAVILGAELCA